jgi:Uma2 family endonuclease
VATEPKTRYTYEDLASFPDDNLRREIIDGELIVTAAPATRHQRAVLEIGAALLAYVKQHSGEVYIAPTDVYFAQDNVVEPDVLFVNEANRSRVEAKLVRGAPDVVVEVSSPSTRRLEIVCKLELYQRFRVTEYWYVDLQADRIEVYRLEGDRYASPRLMQRGDVLVSEEVPGFELAVADVLGPPEED